MLRGGADPLFFPGIQRLLQATPPATLLSKVFETAAITTGKTSEYGEPARRGFTKFQHFFTSVDQLLLFRTVHLCVCFFTVALVQLKRFRVGVDPGWRHAGLFVLFPGNVPESGELRTH